MHSNLLAVPPEISQGSGYLIGLIVVLLILGYLVYSLAKPDKF